MRPILGYYALVKTTPPNSPQPKIDLANISEAEILIAWKRIIYFINGEEDKMRALPSVPNVAERLRIRFSAPHEA